MTTVEEMIDDDDGALREVALASREDQSPHSISNPLSSEDGNQETHQALCGVVWCGRINFEDPEHRELLAGVEIETLNQPYLLSLALFAKPLERSAILVGLVLNEFLGVNMEQQNRQEIEGLKVNLQMLADRLDADFAKNEGFEKETNAKFDFLQTQQDITFQGGNERFMEMSSELTEMTILQDKLQDKLKRLVTAVRGRDVIIEKLQADVKKNTRAVVALENSIQNLQMRITVREVETQHSSA
ncbi:hypothetical protein Sjap_009942 [Stephania japonica]|uniref:Uncharacterized protein n=1 Tax=Stephania japonica TaxID=461633 RepID=A0AAP0J9H3_9MAGN